MIVSPLPAHCLAPPPASEAAWMELQVYLRMLLWSWSLCCCSSWACSLMASCSSSDCWLRPSISHCSLRAFFCQSNTATSVCCCQQCLHLHYLILLLFSFYCKNMVCDLWKYWCHTVMSKSTKVTTQLFSHVRSSTLISVCLCHKPFGGHAKIRTDHSRCVRSDFQANFVCLLEALQSSICWYNTELAPAESEVTADSSEAWRTLWLCPDMDQRPPTEKDGLVISLVFFSLGCAIKVICNKPICMISQLICPALSLSEALAKVRRTPWPTPSFLGSSYWLLLNNWIKSKSKLWKYLDKLTNLVQIDKIASYSSIVRRRKISYV